MKKILCMLLLVLSLTGCQSTNDRYPNKYTEKEAIEYTIERVENEYAHIKELNYMGIDDENSMICFEAFYDENYTTEYKAYIIVHLCDGAFFLTESRIDYNVPAYHQTFKN